MAKTASKSFSFSNSWQSHNFCCFSVRTPRIFQVQVKMLTIQPVFPDLFFVSYDYVGIEFYISHRPVAREEGESNEIRILYGVWRKIIELKTFIKWISKSLNIILQFLWNIIIQNDFSPIAICGDIKQAFLTVRIKEEHRFAW